MVKYKIVPTKTTTTLFYIVLYGLHVLPNILLLLFVLQQTSLDLWITPLPLQITLHSEVGFVDVPIVVLCSGLCVTIITFI